MPEYWLLFSCVGFSHSQLPRPIPSGHFICMAQTATEDTNSVSESARGEVLLKGWGALGRPRRRESGGRANVLDVWAGLGGLSNQSAAQEASRNGVAAREKRYADCGLEDMWAKSVGKRNIC